MVLVMKFDRKMMRLYAVTDRSWLRGQTLLEQVELALQGGVTCLQLREKELDLASFQKEAIEIQKLCHTYGVPFIINDNVKLAMAVGADGVHVGQSDMEAGAVRKKVGENMLIGVSAQTVEQALLAEKHGADYLGVGAVFSTSTKLDACEVSLDTLKDITKAVSIPVVAIGGIGKSNIQKLAGSGIDGVAVVSAIFAADDIKDSASKLRKLSEEMVMA